jgi:NAD(P)-dependent dehydrogenase (short-subunit alcohol dehydrogenase family)
MTTVPNKVWFITGTSSGFGRELVEQLLDRGDRVIATARKPEQLADLTAKYAETALALPLDVTDPASIAAAVDAALAKFGHVDVLVNNAGYGLCGGIEEATEEEFMPVFETNVFGLIRLTRAFLPHFREQRAGNIVNLSSIAGLIGGAGWGYYNASKFAVNGFSEALAAEMGPLGVHVTIVEPGPFRTEFLGRSGVVAAKRIPEYEDTVGKSRAYFQEQSGKQLGDPVKAVKAIIAAVDSPAPPRHLLLGSVAFNRMTARLELWQQEMADCKDIALGADFDAPAAEAK